MEKNIEDIHAEYSAFLDSTGQRKTIERFHILTFIYNMNGHFDLDSLSNNLQESQLRISRATIYNNIDNLVSARLVTRINWGSSRTLYEKAFNNVPHHHMVCTQCDELTEFKDVSINNWIIYKKFKNFIPQQVSLIVYGLCKKCKRKADKIQRMGSIKTKVK